MISILDYIWEAVILTTAIFCLWKYKSLPISLKILAILIIVTILDESIAYYFAYKYHNNLGVYSIYNLVQIFLISLYFNYSIDVFRKHGIGYYIGTIGIIVGVCNIIFLQPLNHSNSYFLFFEGIVCISLALFSFARLMLQNDKEQLSQNPHFWIATLLTFMWVMTFFDWGLYEFSLVRYSDMSWALAVMMEITSIITYGGIGLVFLTFNKSAKNI